MKSICKLFYLNVREFLLKAFLGKLSPKVDFDRDQVRKILVIRLDRIGDMVLTIPLLRSLKKNFPQAQIYVLCSFVTKDLVEFCPYVDHVLVYDEKLNLSQGQFDLVIDPLLDYPIQTAKITYETKSAFRCGFDVAGRGVYYNLPVDPSNEKKHFTLESFEVLKRLGIQENDNSLELFLAPNAGVWLDDVLNKEEIAIQSPFVVIHPGGFYSSQRWSSSSYAQVALYLKKTYGLSTVCIASGQELKIIDDILVASGGGVDFLYNKRMQVSMALMKRAKFFIGNNSGPLHVAAALGLPTISLNGPTVLYRWYPLGNNHIVVNDLLNDNDQGGGDVQNISVEDVLTAVDQQMENLKKVK